MSPECVEVGFPSVHARDPTRGPGCPQSEEKRPDVVVVLDVEMPVMGAQAALRRMSRLDGPPRFMIVTVFAEPRLVRELLALGASAFLPKTASLRQLVAAVRAVSRDEQDKVLFSLPRETLERVGRGPEGKLTDRELEVLVLAARGKSNAGIAQTLNIAVGTVKRHLHNIYGKPPTPHQGMR